MVVVKEYEALVQAYAEAGGDEKALINPEVGNLVIHKNRVLSANEAKGMKVETRETETGVNIHLLVERGAKIKRPVHLCFGVLPQEGLQEIILKVTAQEDSEVEVIAHCLFPNAVRVIHKMDADIEIGNNARFSYKETHYHGEFGGIEVIPKAKIRVNKGGIWESTFTLAKGLVGKLDYDFEVYCQERSVAELVVKAYGRKEDYIKVREVIYLNGAEARGLAKTRLVLADRARGEVRGETYGNAPYARGHVDCIEIVNGEEAVAKAIPVVAVSHGQAKVTHEAAIGSIDRKQLQTLMARGLEEGEAVDVIVKGILK